MVQSVTRTLELLKILGSKQKKWAVAELSEISGLAPSTVHRLLMTLKEHRFVAQAPDSSLYYLGPALISLGMAANNYLDIRKSAMPIMEELAAKSEEDAYLAIADGSYGIFVERVPGPHPLKVVGPVLIRVPLHCGAIRKVLLANSSETFIAKFLEGNLDRYTENTIIDSRQLAGQLAQIKRDGFALTVSEYIKEAVGIGAPVYDHYGDVVASLGIIGPTMRITAEKYPDLIGQVKHYAQQLSFALGYK